jgi:hypothetical protein
MANVNASAWRLDLGNNSDKHVYTMQIEGINGKNEEKITQLMKEWRVTGYIFSNSENTSAGVLYRREFLSDNDFHIWAKTFEYPLEEIGMRKDKIKVLVKKEKIAKKPAKKHRKSGKTRICKTCGKPGHNSRTCGTEKALKATKNLKQCSYCCGFGHNKRTCKEYLNSLK